MDKKALERQRDVIKAKITRIEAYIRQCLNDITTAKRQHVEIRKKHLNECWAELYETQNKIDMTCDEEELDKENRKREENEEIQFDLESQLEDLLDLLPQNNQMQGFTHSAGASATRVRLPTIELPKFSGNYQEWTSFYDLFISLIHNNPDLTQVQKLFYLKGSLDGEARKLLNAFSSTNANYEEAWRVLIKRYQNKRVIVNSHISSLFDMKPIQGDISSLRKLLDTTVENVRALTVLGEATEHWNSLLVYLVNSKVDQDTRQQWELHLKDSEIPEFSKLQEFLEQRCRALEAATANKSTKASTRPTPPSRQAAVHYATVTTCGICKLDHFPHKCETFLKANMEERVSIVKSKSLCFNCLKAGHQTQTCRSSSCRKCDRRHHTLLHKETNSITQQPSSSSTQAKEMVNAHYAEQAKSEKYVLLSTALILVKDGMGEYQQCRALLDSGSQASFVTESCIQRLNLPRRNTTTCIKAVGHLSTATPRGVATCDLTGLDRKYRHIMDALILPKITGLLPQQNLNTKFWTHLKGLQLADPAYCQPGAVDILLGANIYAELIMSGRKRGKLGTPTAHQTTLGWILSGSITLPLPTLEIITHHAVIDISAQLRQFWEVEELPMTRLMSASEQYCEEHFKTTHSRDANGRFTVRLPINPGITQQFGDSRQKAISRLNHLEARLKKDEELCTSYRKFLKEYADLGHMSATTHERTLANVVPYYIPHHAVKKEDSTTTKLRVVFDASSKCTKGISLNDKLFVGPTVQEGLMAIVMRFRIYPFVFTADIAKMFRQILVHQADRHNQKILWRNSFDEPITEYELNTVTYGTACGTYLATKVLQQLADDEKEQFPLAAPVVSTDFYVDDLMSGAMTVKEAIAVQRQLIELLLKGGFELRKWTANNQQLLAHLPAELRATEESLALHFGTSVKALGLKWHPHQDYFAFSVPRAELAGNTKRTILSSTAQLFDPLGWLSPVIIKPKMLMQKLWLLGVDWDEPLPTEIVTEWNSIQCEFPLIQHIKVQRHLGIHNWTDRFELHGFCDSSEAAYAAVAYIRRFSAEGNITTVMLCSKTRVAPLKQLSLPRLELCGAYLLARLLESITKETKLNFSRIAAWTDSTIVLAWLSAPPRKWTTFVANRVALIQGLVSPENWGHVRSEHNPADCASRGLSVHELIGFTLWWEGPPWLCQNDSEWEPRGTEAMNTLLETRPKKILTATTVKEETLPIMEKYSKFRTLLHVTAYCIRFINNCRSRRADRMKGTLDLLELTKAAHYWIRIVQHNEFEPEINRLTAKRPLSPRSNLLSLCPFLDDCGLLRVGGRIANAALSYSQKHPILLPHKCGLTLLIVTSEHIDNLHAGPQLLLSILRHKYWILGGRSLVRSVVQKCVACHRRRAQSSHQLMGNLPPCRVQPGRPFEQVGIDFGGPINVKVSRLRGAGAQRTYKAYIALLVCMVTKAVHLELVTGLTTAALMATLQRFMGRRGKPAHIYSDCGTNFKGADTELQQLNEIAASSLINDQLISKGISWHFNPPGSPHFGGLWEAGIRSTKAHLLTVMGTSTLTFEELNTLLVQVEACLNSRPLCPLSSDPSDLEALTPGHFLIGQALTKPPEPELTYVPMNRLTHWHQVQRLQQTFWKRWSQEYLVRLQQRPKWANIQPNFQIGQLVLLKEKTLAPLKWLLARILDVHPGKDGLIRVVTLKTAAGSMKRAVTNISPLPFENST